MEEQDIVMEQFGCPDCGNRVVDELVWIDDGLVECAACGKRYYPVAAPDLDARREMYYEKGVNPQRPLC